MTNFEVFRPNPDLEMDIHDAAFEEPVAEVNEYLSRLGTQHFIDVAENALSFNGMRYAVVGGGKDRSSTAALLMPGTYANGVWPHIAARGEALAHLAAQAGLRDDEDNLVPVVITGSPSMESAFGLDARERASVSIGDFSPVADRHIDLLRSIKRNPRGIVASSQAATMAAPFVRALPESAFGMGIPAVLAETPHAKRYDSLPVMRQLVNFGREGARFKKQLSDEGIDAVNELFATKHAAKGFEKGIVKEVKDNLAIVKGFARGKLVRDLISLSLSGSPTTVMHGTDSKVARRDDVMQAVEEARERAAAYKAAVLLSSRDVNRLEIRGTNHSLMDRVGRFAVVAAANITR